MIPLHLGCNNPDQTVPKMPLVEDPIQVVRKPESTLLNGVKDQLHITLSSESPDSAIHMKMTSPFDHSRSLIDLTDVNGQEPCKIGITKIFVDFESRKFCCQSCGATFDTLEAAEEHLQIYQIQTSSEEGIRGTSDEEWPSNDSLFLNLDGNEHVDETSTTTGTIMRNHDERTHDDSNHDSDLNSKREAIIQSSQTPFVNRYAELTEALQKTEALSHLEINKMEFNQPNSNVKVDIKQDGKSNEEMAEESVEMRDRNLSQDLICSPSTSTDCESRNSKSPSDCSATAVDDVNSIKNRKKSSKVGRFFKGSFMLLVRALF